jgi:hypothetical protein
MSTQMAPEQEAESFAAHEAIATTLQHYIDGALTGDGSCMRRAFLEDATIRGSYGGEQVDWTLQAFCDLIEQGGPAPNLKARVVEMAFSGSAGIARIEAENWRGTRYTDFFTLIRRDNTWRIASKVFFAHSRA